MKNIKLKLKKYNQEHLLTYYEELTEDEKKLLTNQINNIDFELINKLYNQKKEVIDYNLAPIKSHDTKDEYFKIGSKSVKQGEYAYITLAGGQGTRLGHHGPKGTYILKHGINKSLFELLCDKLKNIYKLTNVYIPWYIMTSNENNDDTIKFFETNNYFNYPKDLIKFFKQEELPLVDMNGKLVLKNKFTIAMGANGNGGVFSSLEKSGYLKDLLKKKVKWVFISGIDNPLIPIDRLDLIGFSIKRKYKISSIVVDKLYPDERVGVFVYKNNIPGVIEYSLLDEKYRNELDQGGKLKYKNTYTLVNLFSIDVLNNIKEKKLPYNTAVKKTYSYIDKKEIDIYKYEMFIFDAFKYSFDIGLLSGIRENIFAPIKNNEGVDSPNTSAELYKNYIKNVNNPVTIENSEK